jgi:hypothetical protein
MSLIKINKDVLIDKSLTLGIVCHDAGGAEVISHFLKHHNLTNCLYYLSGPARLIFGKNLNIDQNCNLDSCIINADIILCGTSWDDDSYLKAINLSKILNKKSIVYLDHWCNYLDRFKNGKEYLYPNEIWCGDEYSFGIAIDTFEESIVKFVNNEYFVHLKNEIQKYGIPSSPPLFDYLYVTEPTSKHALLKYGNERHFGYTEIDALMYFIKCIENIKNTIKICIRPHPSENSEKYISLLDKKLSHINIIIDNNKPLPEQIMQSSKIVGCSSMAMVAGVLSGKDVFCSIPPKLGRTLLPHKEIKLLKCFN